MCAVYVSDYIINLKYYFIGCFTLQTWTGGPRSFIIDSQPHNETTTDSIKCIEFCQTHNSLYSVIVVSVIHCCLCPIFLLDGYGYKMLWLAVEFYAL